jgi:dephospho-CoA kinase
MLKIGITGGIGSGKTTVCKAFEALGIPVYYADAEAKKILSSDPAVKRSVKKLLGDQSYFSNGKPNRKYIAALVFNDKTLLAKLNEIVHPAVALHSSRWFESLKNEYPYALKEAALMIESGSYKEMHLLIVVTAPENIRIQRVVKRDKLSDEEVKKRIQSQMPEKEKLKYANFVICNDGENSVILQVWNIHQKILKRKAH